MATTRLGLWGHGTRRAGSFAGKTPSSGGGGGTHPVDRITRLGLWGHNTQRAGSFAGKASGGGGGGVHPVGRITRLGAWGHNTQRTGSFAGKAPAQPSVPNYDGWRPQVHSLELDDEEIMAAVALFLARVIE